MGPQSVSSMLGVSRGGRSVVHAEYQAKLSNRTRSTLIENEHDQKLWISQSQGLQQCTVEPV